MGGGEDAGPPTDWSGAMTFALRRRLVALQTAGKETVRTRSVLLVDDDTVTRERLGAILERAGFEVHLAADGYDALTLLKNLTSAVPDVLITDAQMPNLDGAALLRQIRSNPRFERTRTIFMSSDHTARRGVDCDAFVAKQRLQADLTDALLRLFG
jgi:CheY-like chemotaxis protein